MKRNVGPEAPVYGTRPWSGMGNREYEEHSRVFYINAAREYAVCQHCTRKECSPYCKPLLDRGKKNQKIDRIRELAEEGKTDKEIAEITGISKNTISAARIRYGIISGREAKRNRKKEIAL